MTSKGKEELSVYFGEDMFPMLNNEFIYQLLGRMQSDCIYFLNYGKGNIEVLWVANIKRHIGIMKALYNSFDDEEKPYWISFDEIEQYERKMIKMEEARKWKS